MGRKSMTSSATNGRTTTAFSTLAAGRALRQLPAPSPMPSSSRTHRCGSSSARMPPSCSPPGARWMTPPSSRPCERCSGLPGSTSIGEAGGEEIAGHCDASGDLNGPDPGRPRIVITCHRLRQRLQTERAGYEYCADPGTTSSPPLPEKAVERPGHETAGDIAAVRHEETVDFLEIEA